MWKFWKNGRMNENEERGGMSENVEEKIERWLWGEGFEVRKRSVPKFNFRYLVSRDKQPNISVFQPKGKTGQIYVESGISFQGTENGKVLHAFDQVQKLSWQLRQHLASKGFYYKFLPPNIHTKNPGAIVFAKPVYYNKLSKAELLNNVFKVINTTIFIILTLQRYSATSFE